MKTMQSRLLHIAVGSVIAVFLIATTPLRAQDDCKALEKVVTDGFSRLHTMPAHVYTTSKISGQSFVSEMIYANGSMYMKLNGKWTVAGSIKDMEQTEQQAKANANSKDSCRHLSDEPVNGELAAVYSSHSETPRGTLDMQLWVSKSKGLILRQDVTSQGGKAVISSRYEYGDVKAPL